MSSVPTGVPGALSSVAAESGERAAGSTHKCGRCRNEFPLDRSPENMAAAHWWLCPACRSRLLGDQSAIDRRWA